MWIPPKRNVGRQVRREKDKQFACLMGYVCPLHQDIKTSGCFCIKIPRDSLDFRPPNDGVCNYPLALAQIVNLTSSANHWHFGTAWNRSRNQTLPWRRCQGARGGGGGAVALQTIRSKSWCFISLINIPVASGCLCAGTDRLMNPGLNTPLAQEQKSGWNTIQLGPAFVIFRPSMKYWKSCPPVCRH